jgi:arylsulfatase
VTHAPVGAGYSRIAAPLIAVLALAALAVLLPSPAAAQLSDAVAIRAEADRIVARNHELSRRAGTGFEHGVLDAIRRSCAARHVTRLDEIVPVAVSGKASPAPAQRLVTLDFSIKDGAAPCRAVEGVDKQTIASCNGDGLVLEKGQVRTTTAIAVARGEVGTIEIDATTTAPGQILVGWSEAADAPRLRRNNSRIELSGDGRMHTYTIDAGSALARGLAANASVRRFFVASRSDAKVVVAGFRVLGHAGRFGAAAFGTRSEEREGELRSVLFSRPATGLAFDVDVPATQPVLETGLGVVGQDAAVEFEVAIEEVASTASAATVPTERSASDAAPGPPDSKNVLLKRLVHEGPWQDVALDLGGWAGKRARITLSVRGSPAAVGLWSSPLVRPRLGDVKTEPVLVVLEDALRADRLSVYGGPVASPAHQRVAAAGVVFERAFAQATQTRSSVPSLMTSLLPSATGAWDFSDSLSDRYVTLAEALRACGFATASFIQNGNAGRYAGLAQGFDVVFDDERSDARPADLVAAGSPLDRWITKQRGRPYFAYVHFLDPHGPYDPQPRPALPDAGQEPELLRDRSIDADWIEHPRASARRALYDAEVATNDLALGTLLDRLAALGDLDRSVLAVLADHGEFLGEHGGMWRHHFPAYVEVARVPLLMRAPGATPARIAQPVALLDVMPTLLALASIDPAPLVMHGLSLASVLRGGKAPARAIPAEEMLLNGSERRAAGCGSFATPSSLWLRSCTRDADYSAGRLLPVPSSGPAPLRRIDLGTAQFAVEDTQAGLSEKIVDAAISAALDQIQTSGIAAWKQMTAGESTTAPADKTTTERLRALGYAE